MISTHEARRRCHLEAVRLGFPLSLFGRIPIHYFDYFRHPAPFDSVNIPVITQMEIMTVFMVINELDVGTLMAFYNASGADLDTVMRLSTFLNNMWKEYHRTPKKELITRFGRIYAYHLRTRTTRYIDGTVHTNANSHRRGNRFVPDEPGWERLRIVRQQIKAGRYRIDDDFDLSVARAAVRGGLMRTGRKIGATVCEVRRNDCSRTRSSVSWFVRCAEFKICLNSWSDDEWHSNLCLSLWPTILTGKHSDTEKNICISAPY